MLFLRLALLNMQLIVKLTVLKRIKQVYTFNEENLATDVGFIQLFMRITHFDMLRYMICYLFICYVFQ